MTNKNMGAYSLFVFEHSLSRLSSYVLSNIIPSAFSYPCNLQSNTIIISDPIIQKQHQKHSLLQSVCL